jgi:riboflavin transporter FmnP
MLVERINGYVPNAEYQRLPLGDLIANPIIVAHASLLLLQAGAAFFGGLPMPFFGAVAVLVVAWSVLRSRRISRTTAILAGMLLLGEIALASLMIVRHPPVYDYYDHRIWYYPLPLQAMVLGLLIAAISKLGVAWSGRQTVVALVLLVAIVVSNVVHWGEYRQAQLRSRWFPVVYAQTIALKESLADGRPRPSLSPEYGALYEVCLRLSPALRARAARIQHAGP